MSNSKEYFDGVNKQNPVSAVDVTGILDQRDAPYYDQLEKIGSDIGYGRGQQILGELWDKMLRNRYGGDGRGALGANQDIVHAEELEASLKSAVLALGSLMHLKDLKDYIEAHEMQDAFNDSLHVRKAKELYREGKDAAWDAARNFLNLYIKVEETEKQRHDRIVATIDGLLSSDGKKGK